MGLSLKLVKEWFKQAWHSSQTLEKTIQQRFGVPKVRVVAVPQDADESEWLQFLLPVPRSLFPLQQNIMS